VASCQNRHKPNKLATLIMKEHKHKILNTKVKDKKRKKKKTKYSIYLNKAFSMNDDKIK